MCYIYLFTEDMIKEFMEFKKVLKDDNYEPYK
jgi:hypothetical protein